MKHFIGLIIIILSVMTVHAQDSVLTIENCYLLARNNYPLIRQHQLIENSRLYTINNANKGYYPQINILGQASYQSDVTHFPAALPGVKTLSKDQYKVYADVSQTIFDGGIIANQKKLQNANALVEEQKLEVELNKLKERVNQLFFGILLIDEQKKQNELVQSDISQGIRKAKASVDNGTAFRSSVDILKAELLKTDQRMMELTYTRKAYMDMLGLLINKSLEKYTLQMPEPSNTGTYEIARPEIKLYDYQRKATDLQRNLIRAKNLPKLSGFLQVGYGRPAFNILSNNFDDFYIGGVRLNIPISGNYTSRNDKYLVDISKKNIEIQKETFLFNTNYSLRQQNQEILKLHELIKTDEDIIALRGNIKKAATAQLENGVITSSDYLREVNAEDNAIQNKILHQIQLLSAQYNQKIISGN